MELEQRFGAANYNPLPVVLTRGQGCHVWDENGNKYLDMMGAYSAVSHGHAHPRLLSILHEQANRLSVVSRAFHTDRLGQFLERACEITGQDMALPMNTGAEAVETALKGARRWAYERKQVPTDQAEVIVCEGNFHGRTLAAIAMSSEPEYRENFGPLPSGFRLIPFGDADALDSAITPNTAAFFVEPIQGEGGIVIPPDGYLARCAEICQRENVLLICDEIQTGLGRTGHLLACHHDKVKPDGLLLGKALGGGILPVSLFLARRDVMELFRPGSHKTELAGAGRHAGTRLVYRYGNRSRTYKRAGILRTADGTGDIDQGHACNCRTSGATTDYSEAGSRLGPDTHRTGSAENRSSVGTERTLATICCEFCFWSPTTVKYWCATTTGLLAQLKIGRERLWS
jgi:ornithine--oxo-acid transaminase